MNILEPPAGSASSDLTFLTNETGSSLQNRFAVLLERDTKKFDCLVGYFFISGFYKIYRSLENVDRIRILVGLSTDRRTTELLRDANAQPQLNSHAAVREQLPEEILRELERAADRIEIEEGVHKFLEWVRTGKLAVRAHPAANLHAKVYIMTFSDTDRDKGRVITGSSNLTEAGLQENLEFNVELKNRSDYEFALRKFNELWATSVDVSDQYDDVIVRQSPFAHFTPYELYLKFLYEYFKGELNRSAALEDSYVPQGFKRLKYQEDAVLSARKILDEYGGVFISDVVGLGKTYMCALLAQQLDGRCLVIAPPHLLDRDKRGSWPTVFSDFQVRQTDFESVGKLDDLVNRDLSKYSNVFIDESHRFRTEATATYENLAQICRGKRVILVSATPLNNRPRDILSQLKLFQNGKNSTIPNVRNLEVFFSTLDRNLERLDRQRERDVYFKTVQSNARQTREKVLKYLMIRRTRSEIEKYYGADMTKQGFKFPIVEDPTPLFYRFSPKENQIFDETIKLLATKLTYARYRPLTYYEGDINERELQGQRNLATFMKILMVKRLESSLQAFRQTMARFSRSYDRVIKEYHNGNVYISKKHINKVFDFLENDDYEAIEELLSQDMAQRLPANNFAPDFIRDLKSDAATLAHIRQLWSGVKRDPKWEAFRDILQSNAVLNTSKLVIFTESQETAEYLTERLRTEVEPRTIGISGRSEERIHRDVIANFDANAFQVRDDFRILVTTEVLAEGVNLHRSNVVINYDIPWNPTRLIQRVGRINRVDTAHPVIHTFNFFPTEEGNDLIKLREAAEAKIHAFIEMLGADARLLTEGEEIKSHDLFTKLSSRKAITGEDAEDESELEYLTEIRQIRDADPDLFTRIKRLPKKARSTRTSAGEQIARPALLTYFRQGELDKFFIAEHEKMAVRELDFLDAAKMLKPAAANEPRRPISAEFYDLLARNKAAFVAATTAEKDSDTAVRSYANDSYILKRLKAKEIRQCQAFTDDDESFVERVIELLTDGALPRPTTKKTAAALRRETEPLRVLGILRRDIAPAFLQPTRAQLGTSSTNPREVILSSFLLNG
jgi:superfamily II DNA/RNA helicase